MNHQTKKKIGKWCCTEIQQCSKWKC